MDLGALIADGLKAGGGAAATYVVGLFSAKSRITRVSKSLKQLSDTTITALSARIGSLESWRNEVVSWKGSIDQEFGRVRTEFQRELEHKTELDAAIEHERSSQRDPLEDFEHRLKTLEGKVARLREERKNYVRTHTFMAFNQTQEEAWRSIREAVGQLRGILESLK